MVVCINLQNAVHVGYKPLFGGRKVFDVLVNRRLDTKERSLVIGLDIERITPVDVVPTVVFVMR